MPRTAVRSDQRVRDERWTLVPKSVYISIEIRPQITQRYEGVPSLAYIVLSHVSNLPPRLRLPAHPNIVHKELLDILQCDLVDPNRRRRCIIRRVSHILWQEPRVPDERIIILYGISTAALLSRNRPTPSRSPPASLHWVSLAPCYLPLGTIGPTYSVTAVSRALGKQ
jgi:hypothetical protein